MTVPPQATAKAHARSSARPRVPRCSHVVSAYTATPCPVLLSRQVWPLPNARRQHCVDVQLHGERRREALPLRRHDARVLHRGTPRVHRRSRARRRGVLSRDTRSPRYGAYVRAVLVRCAEACARGRRYQSCARDAARRLRLVPLRLREAERHAVGRPRPKLPRTLQPPRHRLLNGPRLVHYGVGASRRDASQALHHARRVGSQRSVRPDHARARNSRHIAHAARCVQLLILSSSVARARRAAHFTRCTRGPRR